MTHHRQHNTGFDPRYQQKIPGYIEMAALEDLGPRTIHTLKNLPLPMLAAAIIGQIVEFNDKVEAENKNRDGWSQLPYLDPKDPAVDERISRSLVEQTYKLMRKDDAVSHEQAVAGLRPLVGTPSPKSIREQRKAMRNVRWR